MTWRVNPSNQEAWNFLEIGGNPFRIINIYASNNAPNMFSLWYWLALYFSHATQVLYGDFNMIEKARDKLTQAHMR